MKKEGELSEWQCDRTDEMKSGKELDTLNQTVNISTVLCRNTMKCKTIA